MKNHIVLFMILLGLYVNAQGTNDTIYTENITATKAYLGEYGSVTLEIDDAGNDGQITKPLIVAEGFDSGLQGVENEFGENHLQEFIKDIQDSQSFDLGILLTGNTEFNYGDQDYDIIYVNWDNPRDYLERNAFVLEEVITWVNQEKEDAGSVEQNVVLGQSMGGVLARYALVNMEDDPDLDHDTKLYISHDAPHQGANIPIGIQYFARHIANEFIDTPAGGAEISAGDGGSASIEEMNNLFNQPGTQQLLSTYVDSSLDINNTAFDDWQTELQSKGYPTQTRNIAISNGSFCGNPQEYDYNASLFKVDGKANSGLIVDILGLFFGVFDDIALSMLFEEPALLLGILPGNSKYDINFNAKALPQANSSANVYSGKIEYTKTVLWLIPVTMSITDLSANAYANLSFDVYLGGRNELFDTLNDIVYFDDIDYNENGVADYTQFQADMLNFFAGSANIDFENEDAFGFIPSVSALDVGGGDSNLDDIDYFKVYNADNPPTGDLSIPFHNFISAYFDSSSENERHISFNTRNGNWLAAELDGNPDIFDCSFICGGESSFTGVSQFCTGSQTYSVPAGADSYSWQAYTDPIPLTDNPVTGNVSITSSTNTNSITLTHTGNMSTWITISVVINSAKCDIQDLTFTKRVYVGAPNVNFISVEEDPNGAHQNGNAGINSSEIPLRLNFEPNNNSVTEIEWEKITTEVDWSRDFLNYPGHYVYLFPTCNKDFKFKVRAKNNCGFWSPWRELSYTITECSTNCSSGGDGPTTDNFYLYPLPSNNSINIEVVNEPTWYFPEPLTPIGSSPPNTYTNPNIPLSVAIYNSNSGVLVYSSSITGLPNLVDVSNILPGNYTMHIQYQGQTEIRNIIIN